MGKGKNKQRKKNKRKKFKGYNYSGLEHHQRQGKKLLPPFAKIDNFAHSSWRDDHAPEMLWAFLLAATWPREQYLNCFRGMVEWYRLTFPPPDEPGEPAEGAGDLPPGQPDPSAEPEKFDLACELDHTSLAELSDKDFSALLSIPLAHPLGYAALRPLLLLDSLPGIERWRRVLAAEPTDQDWDTLRRAVVWTLDHQSEISTDVRWLKYVLKIVLGKMRFAGERMWGIGRDILLFPESGDLRSVRPMIRAGEITFRREPPSSWIEGYWRELFGKTGCIDPSEMKEYLEEVEPTLGLRDIMRTRFHVIQQFGPRVTTTRADARLDASFGFVLYGLSLLEEASAPPMSRMLLGRMALRSMAEVVITFTFLARKDDPKLWAAYRMHGNGQAKLAFLKLEEAAGDLPKYVDQAALHEIANEDLWQEFVNMDLGHWANKNLRDLAIEGGTKDVYDRYYDWTSTVTHGMWCAVRDSNFVTCHNSLHRLHRIPRISHRLLPSVTTDALELVHRTFDLLETMYPAMEKIPRLKESTQQAATTEQADFAEAPPHPEPAPPAG